MAKEQDKLKKKLTNKYRMVVLNEETFEERFSFKLSRLNVYVFSGVFSIVLIGLTTLLIAFTPLREYIPGYSSTKLNKKATALLDSLNILITKQSNNEAQLMAMKDVIQGKVSVQYFHENIDSILKANQDSIAKYSIHASKVDSIFRTKIDNKDKYDITAAQLSEIGTILFAPVKGSITSAFDSEKEHYAVDIAVPKNTPIKAIADGTVVFSEWSITTGYVVIIEHGGNLSSVYKHNSQVFKKQGELVKSGEVIASAGSAGELSTGPHLHFELWYNTYPIDPTLFMDFE